MPRFPFPFVLGVVLVSLPSCTRPVGPERESGSFKIHLLLQAIGEEVYEIKPVDGGVTLTTVRRTSDRGRAQSTSATLQLRGDYTPVRLEVTGAAGQADSIASIENGAATVDERGTKRTFAVPERYFTIFGATPFAVQMMMVRYWNAHGKPPGLAQLRARPGAEPVLIDWVGGDIITVDGKAVALDRYTIGNLTFGREILWMTSEGQLAAAMTFAGGLPQEAVRAEYDAALPQLYGIGVAQQMENLAAIGRQVPPEHTESFAITGATLIAGTDAAPVEDSVVVVRDGRIAAAGPRRRIQIPDGMTVVTARGQTLLPGLWEMHTHFSGAEFGPALLAAGITTARDAGGEFDFLVAVRNALNSGNATGPRLLLAGLVDAGGPKAFGHVTAETPEEGRRVVTRYHAAGFQQIKLYTFLAPDVVEAITGEAHRLGMSVTGHVPSALTTTQAIAAGMDQLNHLPFVVNMMRPPGAEAAASVDANSEGGRKAVQFLKAHRTVVDPTIGWVAEMTSYSSAVDVTSFEPGIAQAPFALSARFRANATTTMTAAQMRARLSDSLSTLRVLHKAGVPIIPGTDTGLVGHGLHRELELYVRAGMTPLEAIQSATIVSAQTMGLDQESGSIEVGKRADLMLVDGDPLANISNIRKVSRVVVNGRLFSSAKLWNSVGFTP
jgi:imidazolonepropionase-like amidohydrolase